MNKKMKLTQEQKENIFESTKTEIDIEIKEKAYFDDSICTDLEDIVLEKTFQELGLTDFEKFASLENLNKNIELTQDFLAWLFDKGTYDKDYYDETYFIRLKR